jgi:hypothetical protein
MQDNKIQYVLSISHSPSFLKYIFKFQINLVKIARFNKLHYCTGVNNPQTKSLTKINQASRYNE